MLKRRVTDLELGDIRPIERRICLTEEQIDEIIKSIEELKDHQRKQLGFIAGVIFTVSAVIYVIEHFNTIKAVFIT